MISALALQSRLRLSPTTSPSMVRHLGSSSRRRSRNQRRRRERKPRKYPQHNEEDEVNSLRLMMKSVTKEAMASQQAKNKRMNQEAAEKIASSDAVATTTSTASSSSSSSSSSFILPSRPSLQQHSMFEPTFLCRTWTNPSRPASQHPHMQALWKIERVPQHPPSPSATLSVDTDLIKEDPTATVAVDDGYCQTTHDPVASATSPENAPLDDVPEPEPDISENKSELHDSKASRPDETKAKGKKTSSKEPLPARPWWKPMDSAVASELQ